MFLTLMYHIVDRRIDSPISVSEERFEQHLRHVRREGYRILTLDEVVRIARGDASVPERALFLTFDDAYTDNVSAALPRLLEHGVEATMFVPTKYLGQDNGWNDRAPYLVRHLDWDGVEEWLARGGRVGGHTHGHEDADSTPADDLRDSILLNRRLLAERLGLEIVAFAYPYGNFTVESRETVAGEYEVAFSTDRGTWDVRRDRFAVNRMNVGFDISVLDFALELEQRLDALALGRRAPLDGQVSRPPGSSRSRSAYRRAPGPRVALIAGSGADVLGYPIEPRFLNLLDDGWDVHLIHDNRLLDLGELGALDARTLRQRLHPPPVSLRRPYPRAGLVAGAARSVAARPSAVARTWHGHDDRAHRYRAAMVLAIRPHLVHVPRGAAGAAWLGLRETIRAAFVGPAGVGFPADGLDAAYLEFAEPGADEGRPVIPPTIVEAHLVDRSLHQGDLEGRPFRILAVGDLSWQQGYEHLLHAVRLLDDRGLPCECRIVGSGPDVDALTFARHQLGLLGAVELEMASSPLAVISHLRWADAFVNPAVVPTPPWPLAYARALGVPLVTTRVPQACAEASLVVARRDPVGLADAIERLATDGALRAELAGAAATLTAALPTLDEQLRRFRALYRQALA